MRISITFVLWGAGLLSGVNGLASPAEVACSEKEAASMAAMQGGKLTEAQALHLEKGLAAEPDDLNARTQLLGYYFLRSHTAEAARKARQGHVLWVIQNHPEAEIAGLPYASLDPVSDEEHYHEGRQAWLSQTKAHPQDTRILSNAAKFLLLWDRTTAEALLKELQLLEPGNLEWTARLGQLHKLDLGSLEGAARTRSATKALGYFERALTGTTGDARGSLLEDAAQVALEAGALDKARSFALELLANLPPKEHWDRGNAIHCVNVVLGRLALRSGDVDAAKQYLLEAGRTPGSPQLDSFGPNMQLAKELLQKGQRDVVLEYFELCSRFWQTGAEQLKGWAATVRGGATPDFGANLAY